MFFKRKEKYEINPDTANAILQNVLATQSKAPNSIPFDKLALRQKANSRFYDIMLILVVLSTIITLMVPLGIIYYLNASEKIPPAGFVTITDDYVEGEFFCIEIEGNDVIYDEAWLETTDGTKYPVASYDEEAGIICFPYVETSESNIYIPVGSGDTLHLLLSPIDALQ